MSHPVSVTLMDFPNPGRRQNTSFIPVLVLEIGKSELERQVSERISFPLWLRLLFSSCVQLQQTRQTLLFLGVHRRNIVIHTALIGNTSTACGSRMHSTVLSVDVTSIPSQILRVLIISLWYRSRIKQNKNVCVCAGGIAACQF